MVTAHSRCWQRSQQLGRVHEQPSHGAARTQCSDRSTLGQRRRNISASAAQAPAKRTKQAAAPTAATTPATGSILGAAGLITGSTVGAGILALPTVTQHAGFGPSAFMLVGSWAVLQLQALLIAETNIRCHEREAAGSRRSTTDSSRVITLTEMSSLTLGAPAEAAVSSIYLVMTFTLLLAYTARAGDVIGTGLHIPTSAGIAAFTGGLGGLLAVGGSSGSAKVSSALTAGMIAAFAAVVGQGLTQVDMTHGLQHADWGNAAVCLPVMFLSLVYHDLIPVVCQLLGWDRKRVVAALLVGSATPLLMFVAWEAVCLGLVPYTAGITFDPVDVLIQSQGGLAGTAIAVFSLAALATSGIGVSLSVSNTVKRLLQSLTPLRSIEGVRRKASKADAQTLSVLDCAAILLTLVPPAVCSLGDANIFLTATHLAGAYGMTMLYGVLPPAMAWSCRNKLTPTPRDEAPDASGRLLAGGKPVLVGLASAGLLVEGVQLVLDVPALKPDAVAVTVVQPVFQVASAGITSVSVSAAQFAASMQQPVVQLL